METHLAPGLPLVQGDPKLLQQVLLNIFINQIILQLGLIIGIKIKLNKSCGREGKALLIQ